MPSALIDAAAAADDDIDDDDDTLFIELAFFELNTQQLPLAFILMMILHHYPLTFSIVRDMAMTN